MEVKEKTIMESDAEFQRSLQQLFIKNNKDKYKDITDALNAGDIKTACRLAHTLKSNSGQLGLINLQKAAADAEKHLKNDKNLLLPHHLPLLETELNAVLEELSELVISYSDEKTDNNIEVSEMLSREASELLFDKLELMLKFGNTESLKQFDNIRRIPADESLKNQLILQISEFDFDLALETLKILMNKPEID